MFLFRFRFKAIFSHQFTIFTKKIVHWVGRIGWSINITPKKPEGQSRDATSNLKPKSTDWFKVSLAYVTSLSVHGYAEIG